MSKPALILQARPETPAADAEFAAICDKGGLNADQVKRVRLDIDPAPKPHDLDAYQAVILGGGPGCVSDPAIGKDPIEAKIESVLLGLMPTITARDMPFMGCCLGIGILGQHFGDFVSKEAFSEPVGVAHCTTTPKGQNDPLLSQVDDAFDAFVGHKEALQTLPSGCEVLVTSPSCPYQMIRFGENVYATQFHPEADAKEFELRIRLYRDRGYFAPEDAENLIALCKKASVTQPKRILRNFVERYLG